MEHVQHMFEEVEMKKMHENTMQAPTRHSPLDAHSAPGSVDGENFVLHPATLQLVDTLLAGKRVNGGDVLLALLEHATAGTGEDVAIIKIKSVQQFSTQLLWPWGYTTTCKILLVLEALGVIERHRHLDGVELRISLGPPKGNLAQISQALDRLLQRKTPKVQRLAARVKERLQQGNLLPGNEFPAAPGPAELQAVTDYLQQLLEAHGVQISLFRRQELVQASQTIAHLLCPARFPAPAEGNLVSMGNLCLPKIPKESADGESKREPRACAVSAGTSDSPGRCRQGNLRLQASAEERSAQPLAENSSSGGASEFPALLENSPAEEQKGNSSFSTTFNVNRNTLSEKEINENVTRQGNPFEEPEGNVLARAVEGHTANARAYRHYLTYYDPRMVLAAFIYLKQRQYGHQCRPIASPGAYFDTVLKAWGVFGPYEAACEAYHRACAKTHGAPLNEPYRRLPGIPLEVQEMVNDFWGWPYDEVAEALQEQLAQASRPQAGCSPAWESLQSIPWLREQNQFQEPHYVPKRWMDRDEALRLMERIREEARTIPSISLQLAPEPRPYRPRGTSQTVYLVDLVIERIPQVYAEPAQWQMYYHDVQACLRMRDRNGCGERA